MPRKRDLARSLQFRYRIESVGLFLQRAVFVVAGLSAFIAIMLMLFGPLFGLISTSWPDIAFFGKWAVILVIVAPAFSWVAGIACDYSNWQDNRAASRGLSYWPGDGTEEAG